MDSEICYSVTRSKNALRERAERERGHNSSSTKPKRASSDRDVDEEVEQVDDAGVEPDKDSDIALTLEEAPNFISNSGGLCC